jgi:hypothetical protein
MPVLVLAARMCPEGVEATLFATLMSILNGGAFVGSALGGVLTAFLGVKSDNFDHLFELTAICVATTLLPMPFLALLPSSLDQDATGNSGGGGGAGAEGAKGGGGAKGGAGGGSGGGDEEEGLALLGAADGAGARPPRRGGGGGDGGDDSLL